MTTPAPHRYPLVVPERAQWLSAHALERYRERTEDKRSDKTVLAFLGWKLGEGVELELKKRFRVIEMIDHGEHARYFRNGNLVFVVASGIVVTIHEGTADRWKFKGGEQ